MRMRWIQKMMVFKRMGVRFRCTGSLFLLSFEKQYEFEGCSIKCVKEKKKRIKIIFYNFNLIDI